jgi:hypothetical protein
MSEAQLDLARRAVACKGWRWMPGMAWLHDLAQPITSDGIDGRHDTGTPPRYGLPDLTDHATLGCLLALVREAWGELGLVPCLFKEPGEWNVYLPNSDFAVGETEAEALVVALKAAPEVKP